MLKEKEALEVLFHYDHVSPVFRLSQHSPHGEAPKKQKKQTASNTRQISTPAIVLNV
jgi:hypothetical protein